MSNILPGIVPLQVGDDCAETVPINCGEEVVGNNTEASFSIEFPRDTRVVPLAGCAVLSIKAVDLKMKPS